MTTDEMFVPATIPFLAAIPPSLAQVCGAGALDPRQDSGTAKISETIAVRRCRAQSSIKLCAPTKVQLRLAQPPGK